VAHFLTVRGRIRDWWPLMVVAPFLIATWWLLYVVWRSPQRSDLAVYGAFAVPVVTVMTGWIAWAWRAKSSLASPTVTSQDLDRVADLLALAVKTQWERAASERGLVAEPIPVTWGRPSIPLAGPVTAAVGSRRFAPLPGLTPVREVQLAAGWIDDLHDVYGGLGSGRLVVAGAPGSGKSSAAVLLVLAALRHRDEVRAEDRTKIPVPVLFTAQDWDPRQQPVKGWLTGRLQQTYPLFAGWTGTANAGGLIDAGKLTVILDGLDEIAEELRPVALQALSQANFRVVVLSRTAEMASAISQHGMLQDAAAVELRIINPATAAGYLERIQVDPPPSGWQDLINRIRASPASPLTEMLNSPLALTLIRDTYLSDDDARELLDYCDTIQQRASGVQTAEAITGHLLDRVLPAAYTPRPGQPPPRYDLQTAQNALARIATRMNHDGTRDLQWWQVPRWAPPAPRIIVGGLVACLLVEFAFALVGAVIALVTGIITRFPAEFATEISEAAVYTLLIGAFFGLAAGGTAGVAARGTGGPPTRIGKIRRPKLRRVLTTANLVIGVLVGLISGLWAGLSEGLVAGIVLGPASGVCCAAVVNYAIKRPARSTEETGKTRLRRVFTRPDVVVGLAVGLVLGLMTGILFGLKHGVITSANYGITMGVFGGMAAGLAISLANAFTDPDSTSSPSPATSWHNDRRHAMAIGVVVGVVIGVVTGVAVGALATSKGDITGLQYGLGCGIVFGLMGGLVGGIGISHAWPTRLAAAQLAMRWRTPLKLMDFLDDARKRNVLRTVGPVYQFRHARLQDHLAAIGYDKKISPTAFYSGRHASTS
jgi:hypothetical protein